MVPTKNVVSLILSLKNEYSQMLFLSEVIYAVRGKPEIVRIQHHGISIQGLKYIVVDQTQWRIT